MDSAGPVILAGLAGSAVSLVLFGASTSFWWAVGARVLAGASNGNASVIRAVLGEITDATNEGRAFSFWSICWDLALIVSSVCALSRLTWL